MTDYVDTYIACADGKILQDFAANFVTTIPVQSGRPTIPGGVDADGNSRPGVAAAGDPALHYLCVRSTVDISPLITAPLVVVDAAVGASVVGVFA